MKRGRDQMGSGGDSPGMGSLGWSWVGIPATSWAVITVTRMIPSRTAFLMAYEAAILTHVVSMFNWG